jgi:hypothetical protein
MDTVSVDPDEAQAPLPSGSICYGGTPITSPEGLRLAARSIELRTAINACRQPAPCLECRHNKEQRRILQNILFTMRIEGTLCG